MEPGDPPRDSWAGVSGSRTHAQRSRTQDSAIAAEIGGLNLVDQSIRAATSRVTNRRRQGELDRATTETALLREELDAPNSDMIACYLEGRVNTEAARAAAARIRAAWPPA